MDSVLFFEKLNVNRFFSLCMVRIHDNMILFIKRRQAGGKLWPIARQTIKLTKKIVLVLVLVLMA